MTLCTLVAVPAASSGPDHRVARVQRAIDALKAQLAITADVSAAAVDANELLVSVSPAKGRVGAFVLSVEADFVDELSDRELDAVVAHELGHVWIFTHHPYLHTERLANQIAMRVVSRHSLEEVYAKVWRRRGVPIDLQRFLGQ